MTGLGAPVEIDNVGFNKVHYGHPITQKIVNTPVGSSLPVAVVSAALKILQVYKKKQVPEYDQIYKDLQNMIVQKQFDTQNQVNMNPEEKIVKYVKEDRFSYAFFIPQLKSKDIRTIKSSLEAFHRVVENV